MKKPLLTIAISTAAITLLDADTITWTGNGDGRSWNDTANWVASSTSQAPDHVPLSAENSGDQVVISGTGVEVEYNGDDPRINAGESLTISDGATLTQTVANWWYGENGTVTIDGGAFDTGSCSGTHTWANIDISNGGTLIARTDIPDSNVTLDASSIYEKMSANSYTYAGTEKFNKFTGTGQNVEVAATASALEISNVVWACKLFSAPALAVKWVSGSLVTWDTGYGGYYNAGGTIDIVEGWTGSFTFAYASASVFANCFQNKITYNGTALTAETFAELFDVAVTTVTDPEGTVHAASRVSLARATDWKLGALSATGVSASAATVSTVVEATGDGAFTVYVACDTDIITEGNVIAKGETVTESSGVYYKTFSSLDENAAYNYAFAIVTNGAVAAFKSASFVASDYEYIYMDGAWLNGAAADLAKNANAEGGSDSALIVGTLTVTGQEICPSRKKLKDAVVSANTVLLGEAADSPAAAMEVCNSAYVNNKTIDLASNAPYGIYACPRAMNFTSASGNGVVRRGDAYTCYATEEQCVSVYANLFANEKIRLNGAAVGEDAFRASFTTNAVDTDKTIMVDEVNVPLKQLTITYWEPVWTGVPKTDWTVQPGARVKLTKDTWIGVLTVADATDVKIDLNGYNLKVVSLFVDGEKKKGEFTAGDLPMLAGEGSLTVSGPGFAIIVR